MAKIATITFDEEVLPQDALNNEDACVKLEDAGYTVYSDYVPGVNENGKSGLPRPKRPV